MASAKRTKEKGAKERTATNNPWQNKAKEKRRGCSHGVKMIGGGSGKTWKWGDALLSPEPI